LEAVHFVVALAARDPRLAASMQTGVEIHLHQGKPGVRAANTHCVAQASGLADHPSASF
jgi:hypothetical protein